MFVCSASGVIRPSHPTFRLKKLNTDHKKCTMKRIFTNESVVRLMCVVTMWLTCTYGMGQVNLGDVASQFPTTQLPYYGGKGTTCAKLYGIDNSSGAIPNKIYENFQCTEYLIADFDDMLPAAYDKFQVPNQNNVILAIEFGGATCYLKDVLVLLNKDGQISDTLEGCVGFCLDDWFYAKQYRIMSDGSIIVTVLEPVQETSVPFKTFKQVYAHRVDYTYKVVNDKFFLDKTQKYVAKTYTYELLANENYNLWNGNEQLLNE